MESKQALTHGENHELVNVAAWLNNAGDNDVVLIYSAMTDNTRSGYGRLPDGDFVTIDQSAFNNWKNTLIKGDTYLRQNAKMVTNWFNTTYIQYLALPRVFTKADIIDAALALDKTNGGRGEDKTAISAENVHRDDFYNWVYDFIQSKLHFKASIYFNFEVVMYSEPGKPEYKSKFTWQEQRN